MKFIWIFFLFLHENTCCGYSLELPSWGILIQCIFFLFLHENICCSNSLRLPSKGKSNEYPQHMFSWANINIFLISHWKYLLWVLTVIAFLRQFNWVPITYTFTELQELWQITLQRCTVQVEQGLKYSIVPSSNFLRISNSVFLEQNFPLICPSKYTDTS